MLLYLSMNRLTTPKSNKCTVIALIKGSKVYKALGKP